MCPIPNLPQEQYPAPSTPGELHSEQSVPVYSIVQPPLWTKVISPPLFMPAGTPISFCQVDQMNPEQTADYIGTYSRYKGWKEAQKYAESFKKQSISGCSLQELDNKMLEEQVGISDPGHRMELLSTFQRLFQTSQPQRSNNVTPMGQSLFTSTIGSTFGSEYNGSFVNNLRGTPTPTDSFRGQMESDRESTCSRGCVSSCPTENYLAQVNTMSESGYRERTVGEGYMVNGKDNGLQITTMAARKSLGAPSVKHTNLTRISYPKAEESKFEAQSSYREVIGSVRSIRRSVRSTAGSTYGEDTRSVQSIGYSIRSTAGSIRSVVGSVQSTVGSVQTSVGSVESTAGSIRSTRRASFKKLIIAPGPEQFPQDGLATECIRQMFAVFDDTVRVHFHSMEDSTNKYLVVFGDCEMAHEAFHWAEDNGYRGKVKKEWPERPSPKRPIQYMALEDLRMRKGKALSGDVVGTLLKGDVVSVNQLKGRRARIREFVDGAWSNKGWVSVHSKDGKPLLVQLAEL